MGRHAIHLGGAWQPPVASERQLGHECWRRSFGRPSGVGPADRVLLVLDRPSEAGGTVRLALNTLPLPPAESGPCRWEHDVTTMLVDRNELMLDPSPAAPPDPGTVDRHGRATLPPVVGRLTIEIVSD
jgi:hypothetical protein